MRKFLLLLSVVALFAIQAMAQTTVPGKVTDENGKPLSDVSVLVKGTRTGTITKADGSYSITVPANAKALVFTAINQAPLEVEIGTKTVISPTLNSEDKTLSEVVIVGYQTVKRTDITGAVAEVKGTELAEKPVINFTQLLQGKATGVQVTGQSGRPGSSGYIRVRGTGSINASNEPLI